MATRTTARARAGTVAASKPGVTGNGDTANGAVGGGSAGGRDEALLHDLLAALRAACDGDFSVRLRARRDGVGADVIEAFNELISRNAKFSKELERVRKAVGREGRMSERFSAPDSGGTWAANAEAVNGLVEDLARPRPSTASP